MTCATLDGWIARTIASSALSREGQSAEGNSKLASAPLTRAALEAWQLARLRETITHARARSPFYRALPGWPDAEIRALRDITAQPFTFPADVVRNDPPFLALSQSAVARVVTLTTSGTSGEPKRIHFTAEDQHATLDFFHHGMALFTRPGERVAIAFPGERPGSIGDGLATALRRLGAEPCLLPMSPDMSEFVARLRHGKPDVIAGPPVPILAAARVSASDGSPPLKVRTVLLSSDYVAQSLAAGITEAWGAEVYRHWGMTETGYGGAVDCALHAGCHLREHELYAEVVAPDTGASLPHGALGELVITTLTRRAFPLIRYRTGDLVRLIAEPCGCGSILRRLDAFGGRVGEGIALPEGRRLTQPMLDELLFGISAVTDFTASFTAGSPATLALSIATTERPPSENNRATIRRYLRNSWLLGPAVARGALRIDIGFATEPLCQRDAKRQIRRAKEAPCEPSC